MASLANRTITGVLIFASLSMCFCPALLGSGLTHRPASEADCHHNQSPAKQSEHPCCTVAHHPNSALLRSAFQPPRATSAVISLGIAALNPSPWRGLAPGLELSPYCSPPHHVLELRI